MSANSSVAASTAEAVEFDLKDKENAPLGPTIDDTVNAVCDSRHHNALLVTPEFDLEEDDKWEKEIIAKERKGKNSTHKKGKRSTVDDFDRGPSIFALSVKPGAAAKRENHVGSSVLGSVGNSPIIPPAATHDVEPARKGKKRQKATKNSRAFVEVGDPAPDFELEDSQGIMHKLSHCRGRKVLLSFFRFAACHQCLYNIDMMKRQYEMLRKAGIAIICVFKSTPQNISKFASQTLGDGMLALSDKQGATYKCYQVKKSAKNIPKSALSTFRNREKLRPYFNKGFFRDASVSGMRLLPADFLIDENGIIVDLFRAEGPGKQHMPFERIEAFIPEGKRCKCNKKDCVSPTCQRNYVKEPGRKDEVLGPNTGHVRCARRTCIQT